MTLQEALKIAEQAKPKRRLVFDKLQGSTTAAPLSAGAEALIKRLDGMGETLSVLQKRIDQIAADVEYLENFKPGARPRRLQ